MTELGGLVGVGKMGKETGFFLVEKLIGMLVNVALPTWRIASGVE